MNTNERDLIQKLFKYEYQFAIVNIISKFLFHFENSYENTQHLVLEYVKQEREVFIHVLKMSIKGLEVDKVTTNIDSTRFPKKNNPDVYHHFTEFELVRFYYSIPEFDTCDKRTSSFIINFHINYLKKAQLAEMNLDDTFRFLIHFVEIIFELEKCTHIIDLANNDIIEDYPFDILEYIENGIIQGLNKDNSTTSGKNIIKILYNQLEIDIQSSIVIKSTNYLESIKSTIPIFKKFLLHHIERKKKQVKKFIDVTKHYEKEHEINSVIVTEESSKEYENEISNYEEKLEHKSNKKIKIRCAGVKKDHSTRKQQKRHLEAKSLAIAKSKMELRSLYSYPTISEISIVLKDILKSKSENSKEQYYKLVFLLAIVLGLTPKDVLNLLKGDIKYTIERTLPSSLHARFDNFNDTVGIKTSKIVSYQIPLTIQTILLSTKVMQFNFDENDFLSIMKDYLENQNIHFSIQSKKIWDTFFVHQSIFHKTPNTQSILATGNLDQNASPLVAYTQTTQNLKQHSLFLEEYLTILDINDKNQLDESLNLEIIDEDENVGSLKLIKHDSFGNMLNALFQLAKYEDDEIKKFNLYSIYIRYALAMLIGTRDFKKSVDLSRVCFKYKIIHIQEKAKHENDGHRVIPLCETAVQLIVDYLNVLQKFDIFEKNICLITETNKILEVTNANIKQIQKKMFVEEKYAILNILKSIPLNVGRHTMVTLANDLKIAKDDILAFMGHNVSGSEFLGELSFINGLRYEKEFRLFLEEIAMIFSINKNIKVEVGLY